MSSTRRNRPLFSGFGAVPKKAAPKPLRTPEEAFADEQSKRDDFVAAWLGICTVCAEYKHRIDGEQELRCLTCDP